MIAALAKWIGSTIGFYVTGGFIVALLAFGGWQWAAAMSARGTLADERAAHAQTKAAQAEAIADGLREREREISRLLDVAKNLNEAYREQIRTIDDLERDRRADAGRLQRLAAERRAAIQAATDIPSLRGYATTAGDVYGECRGEYQALGLSIERCAAGTRALQGWASEVTRKPLFNIRTPSPPASTGATQ